MPNRLQSLQNFLFAFFIILFPTQLALFFWPDWALIFGIRVDYIAPKIYFTDLLILVLVLIEISKIKDKTKIISSFLLVSILVLFTNKSPNILFNYLTWIKLTALLIVLVLNKNSFKIVFAKVLPATVLWVFFLSFLQVIFQRTIGGPFYFIGERTFTVNTPGIALVNIADKLYMRPYATFPHPNVLAGFSLVASIYLASQKKKNKITKIALIAALLLVVISFSQGAWIAGLIIISFYLLRQSYKLIVYRIFVVALIILSLFLIVFSTRFYESNVFPSMIAGRLRGMVLAGDIFSKHPVLGSGLGSFIINSQESLLTFPNLFSGYHNSYLQPVHNIYLLVLAELGIVGLILLFLLLYQVQDSVKNNTFFFSLLAVLVTGFFDHYWLTLHQGQLLLVLIFFFSFV